MLITFFFLKKIENINYWLNYFKTPPNSDESWILCRKVIMRLVIKFIPIF